MFNLFSQMNQIDIGNGQQWNHTRRKRSRSLVGPSFACEIVECLRAKLLPKAAQVVAQRDEGITTLVWASAARDTGNFCVLSLIFLAGKRGYKQHDFG